MDIAGDTVAETKRRGMVVARTTWFAVVEPHELPRAANAGPRGLGRRIVGFDVVDLGCAPMGIAVRKVRRVTDRAEAEALMHSLNLARSVEFTDKGLLL